METAQKTIWKIDDTHSEIGFKVKHMMISIVKGHFEEYTSSIEASEEDFGDASFHFSAKIESINTKNNDRDAHLKSDDFFNAASYPEMTFMSKSFDGNKLVGDLTIRDVTKEVSLEVDLNGVAVDPYGQTKAGFEMRGDISRKDFGLTWNAVTEAGSVVVSDKVNLIIDAQFVKS
ncbi:polyisoprenoid-binding protein [Aquimarina sp. U1-2]|uniref:YceI family protein n=1 Tax=Aquimarina sp. U1-2 TaxID=2823141 RepID=UPI001AEC731C|nr:YceI family protein [Aquimarina sp. U1-2]MBP2831825.1 polyisoprenoid-binding protein [Aquimarina sp. U1-2]